MTTGINETRVFGPPGTGKTTYTSKCITEAAEKFGSENILVASFTKAAAKELVSRGQSISNNQIGTLHAQCFRMLGSPKIAEANVKDFNNEYPHFALSGGSETDIDDGLASNVDNQDASSGGNELMARANIYRARMIPKDLWIPNVLDFYRHWSKYKHEENLMDFQDLIETAIEYKYPPNNATIGIFDEVQDFTPSQLKLIRKWAEQMHWILMAGDDDQTLYSFTGATPNAFLNPPVGEEHKRVLRQSYRVPTKVLNMANAIIKKVSIREPKEYKPRDHDGKIFSSPATWKKPNEIIKVIDGYMRQGKRVMVLATCSYMLSPIIMQLRDAGIPFSNIYKANRGDWNPIKKSGGEKSTAYSRLIAYMQPEGPEFKGTRLWTAKQIERWVDPMKVEGNFTKGAKKILKEMCKTKEVSAEVLLGAMLQAFTEEAFDKAFEYDLGWFLSQITPAKQKSFEFPARVFKQYGEDGPEMAQFCTIGTIHSVKGAEADVVVLFPDISLRGAQSYSQRSGEQFDQILRQFYVGVTRTRDILIICQGITQGMFFDDFR